MGITMKTLHDYGAFAKNRLAEMRLKEVSWNGENPVMDLRVWIDSKTAKNGITMSKKELKKLGNIIDSLRNNKDLGEEFPMNEPETDDDEVIDFDSNGITKTKETGKNDKPKSNAKEQSSKEKKDVIIKFPEHKNNIKVAQTKNEATYELCKEKLDREVKPFNKAWEEIEYLYDGINKELKENEQFCRNFYREEKTFVDMFHYLNRNAADNSVTIEGVMIMLHSTALGICIDYFNAEDEPKVEKKVEVKKPAKKKATKTTTSKKTTKPKTKLILEDEDDDDEVISF